MLSPAVEKLRSKSGPGARISIKHFVDIFLSTEGARMGGKDCSRRGRDGGQEFQGMRAFSGKTIN